MSSKRNPNARQDWQTPEWLVGQVKEFAVHLGFLGITLDPATVKENPTGAEYIRTPDCDPDGLTTEWFSSLSAASKFVYVNPEYRAAWYAKILLEAARMGAVQGNHMVALLPAKPGTGYFQDLAKATDALLFLRGRLTFRGIDEPAPFESALLYFGERPFAFLAHFEEFGWGIL